MLQARRHRRAAAVLGERQLGLAPAHRARIHNFVRLSLLQNAVLMDAARMCKRILAHNRFAALHRQTAHPRNQF